MKSKEILERIGITMEDGKPIPPMYKFIAKSVFQMVSANYKLARLEEKIERKVQKSKKIKWVEQNGLCLHPVIVQPVLVEVRLKAQPNTIWTMMGYWYADSGWQVMDAQDGKMDIRKDREVIAWRSLPKPFKG